MKNFEFVQSIPAQTTLGEPDIREALEVWLEMINSAKKTICIGQFYINSIPTEPMEQVLQALIKAGERGVSVRMVTEKMMSNIYPQSIERLNKMKNIEVRLIESAALLGGIMHAKYIVVDGEDSFLGSQNFDYLSLTQIHEMGIRVKNKKFAEKILEVFVLDWELCETKKMPEINNPGSAPLEFVDIEYNGQPFKIAPVFSPQPLLPSTVSAELPHIVNLINSAKFSIFLNVMEYSPKSQYKPDLYFDDLDGAFRRVAARGVNVKILATDWCMKNPNINYLKSISMLPNIEVKLMTIPRLKERYLPYARVSHCKYLVIDKARAWIGSSNWEPDYFFNSRNVSAIIEGAAPVLKLREIFLNSWTAEYSQYIEPMKNYRQPQITD